MQSLLSYLFLCCTLIFSSTIYAIPKKKCPKSITVTIKKITQIGGTNYKNVINDFQLKSMKTKSDTSDKEYIEEEISIGGETISVPFSFELLSSSTAFNLTFDFQNSNNICYYNVTGTGSVTLFDQAGNRGDLISKSKTVIGRASLKNGFSNATISLMTNYKPIYANSGSFTGNGTGGDHYLSYKIGSYKNKYAKSEGIDLKKKIQTISKAFSYMYNLEHNVNAVTAEYDMTIKLNDKEGRVNENI